MINEETRHHEKPGHQEDDENDMTSQNPIIGVAKISRHGRSLRMRLSSITTCSIVVSDKMPWPRLKIWGRFSKAVRIFSTEVSNARTPSLKAKGSRLHCTGKPMGRTEFT